MAVKLFTPIEKKIGFLAIEKLNFFYNFFTTILILVFYTDMNNPNQMLFDRFLIVLMTFAVLFVYDKFPNKLTVFLRFASQIFLLIYWYPNLYEFSRLFPNLDHLFAAFEQQLFGCQPALLFCNSCPAPWISELFNLGYFSYYPMISVVVLFYFFWRYAQTDKITFIIIGSFYLYYIIYLFLPVAGPQFYFPALDEAQVANGIFPELNNYFHLHPELEQGCYYHDGFFGNLVHLSQQSGERPIAAFPSSHVGISTVVLILAYKGKKAFFFCLLPFYLLLCGATVYIQAHYVIDVFAGLITAFLFYYLTNWIYNRWLSD